MVEGARLSKEYRVYVIGRDGHIVSRMDLRCLDEEEATEKARLSTALGNVELWQGDRRIETFKHNVP
jgi:hypothetical protein